MTVKYINHPPGYSFVESEDAAQGRMLFIRDDDKPEASATLPTIGVTEFTDPDGADVDGCIARSRTADYLKGDINTIRYTYDFSTVPPDADDSSPGDTESRRFTVGGEVTQIPDPAKGGWVWSPGGGACNQAIYKRIVTGTFYMTHVVADSDRIAFLNIVVNAAGKINSVPFENFNVGNVLFNGIEGTDRIGRSGREWPYSLSFSYRLIQGNDPTGAAVATNTWQYVWNTDANGWARPTNGGAFLYQTSSFAGLKP